MWAVSFSIFFISSSTSPSINHRLLIVKASRQLTDIVLLLSFMFIKVHDRYHWHLRVYDSDLCVTHLNYLDDMSISIFDLTLLSSDTAALSSWKLHKLYCQCSEKKFSWVQFYAKFLSCTMYIYSNLCFAQAMFTAALGAHTDIYTPCFPGSMPGDICVSALHLYRWKMHKFTSIFPHDWLAQQAFGIV